MKIIRSNSKNKDFVKLIRDLDNNLNTINGDEQKLYDGFNKIDMINHVIIIYLKDKAVACGSIKKIDSDIYEVKRMFVDKIMRRKGVASKILKELETWAIELGAKKLILETGIKQVDAIKLYENYGFTRCSNYGEYIGLISSVCFQKFIKIE